jgi:hypothetical protein
MRRIHDPSTQAIVDQTTERNFLRAEVRRLSAKVDAAFAEGYDQAVQEVRGHFAGRRDVVAEIEEIWKISLRGRSTTS